MPKKLEKLSLKDKKTFKILAIIIFLLFMGFFTWCIGKPIVEFASDPEKFKMWVDTYGILGRVTFVLMVFVQVVVALIPGEPLEMVAGYAFGAIEGTLLCVIGITLGSLAVLFLVKCFGVRFVEVFFDTSKIQNLKFLKNEKRRNTLIFFLFFLPGTPKDLLTYFVGLVDMKMTHFLLIVSIARLPSIITSTLGGDALGLKKYKLAIIIMVVTLALSAIGYVIYTLIHRAKSKNK